MPVALLLVLSILLSAQTWTLVKKWDGNGTKETESFNVVNEEWRISWEAAGEDRDLGMINIGVYDQDGKRVSNASGKVGLGDTYVRGAGRYYLKIASANVRWTVKVEERF